MKKIASIVLALALMATVAVPMLVSAAATTTYTAYKITDPNTIAFGEDGKLPIDESWEEVSGSVELVRGELLVFVPTEALDPGVVAKWTQAPDRPYPISLIRGNVYRDNNALLAEAETELDEPMIVSALDTGIVNVIASIAGEGDAANINVKVQEPKPEGPGPSDNNFFTILKIYWADLQWTWTNEIHPFLKYLFYQAVDFVNATVASVQLWWSKLWKPDSVVVTEP